MEYQTSGEQIRKPDRHRIRCCIREFERRYAHRRPSLSADICFPLYSIHMAVARCLRPEAEGLPTPSTHTRPDTVIPLRGTAIDGLPARRYIGSSIASHSPPTLGGGSISRRGPAVVDSRKTSRSLLRRGAFAHLQSRALSIYASGLIPLLKCIGHIRAP